MNLPAARIMENVHEAILRANYAEAELILKRALSQSPNPEFLRSLGGIYKLSGRNQEAEALWSDVLKQEPHDVATAFALARLYRDQARVKAASDVLCTSLYGIQIDAQCAIEATKLLAECNRPGDAAALVSAALTVSPRDLRLHIRAAMLAMQLGEFHEARQSYLRTFEDPRQACEWHAPHGLANTQRYMNADHPDFLLFQKLLARTDLTPRARASLLFALGKACDDIGDYTQAVSRFRQANALILSFRVWTRKQWRRTANALLAAPRIPAIHNSPPGIVPVLIVGMPRSGSTLVAELLSNHPDVCNRGEMPWLGQLMQGASLVPPPDAEQLGRWASMYAAYLRRDDADAHWIIDKQPFNFRYIGAILAMFPDARIIECVRSPRDTALSLWMQSFADDIQQYACDFDDIATVMHDCARLMNHWRKLYPESIQQVSYEALVRDPSGTIGTLATWLGLPTTTALPMKGGLNGPRGIDTASLWQARQPVHQQSIGRWQNYSAFVHELERFAVT